MVKCMAKEKSLCPRGAKGAPMKISQKMILLFSSMILLIVAINTSYLRQTNVDGADAFTADRFRNMAVNMVRSMEQYVATMDLAIEDLTSDTAFMEAFYQVVMGGEDGGRDLRASQNKMFQTMLHSVLADSFSRVSVFSDNGFFLSSHIDRNDSIVSLSDESREMIANIPYLKAVKSAPYRRHLIAPHKDYFKVSRDRSVFSAVHAVTWHGEAIGYIQVDADVAQLDSLLLTDNDNVMIRATFADGSILYASPDDEAVYDDVPLDDFVDYTDPCGLERNVYHVQSRWLGLDIYIAQDASVRYTALNALTWNYVKRSLVIAAAALLLVVVISLSLTNSMRRLNRRVRGIPVDQLMLSADTTRLNTFVTRPEDKEIHELENSFNQMLFTLRDATQNEVTLRESTLRAHLKALQAQINPHFVYNTLNIISAKGMESGNEEIIDMCDQFAQMLRYSTDTRSDIATLGEDLAHTQNYLRLLKARYEEHLIYSIHVPDDIGGTLIPKLTLQPIVENAITHSFERGSNEVRVIAIAGTLHEDKLSLEIRDNGAGFLPEVLAQLQRDIKRIEAGDFSAAAPAGQNHIGLLNTCLRLHYYSRGSMRMELRNDSGAVVRLTMNVA